MESPEQKTDAPERTGLEKVVFALAREQLYLPVTFVIALHLALALATALIYVIREQAWLAVVLLLAAVAGSVKLVRLEVKDLGRPGAVLGWILFIWLATGALSWGVFDWLCSASSPASTTIASSNTDFGVSGPAIPNSRTTSRTHSSRAIS